MLLLKKLYCNKNNQKHKYIAAEKNASFGRYLEVAAKPKQYNLK